MTKSTKIVAVLGVIAGLGVASLPLGTFATTYVVTPYGASPKTVDTEIELTIGNAVGIATNAEKKCSASTLPNTTASCQQIISIGTNSANGMTLTVADKDANTDLTNTAANDKIVAANGDIAAGDGKWNISGGLLSKKAITNSAQNVYVGTTAEEKDVSMTYNFATRANQKSGVYTDKIVYSVNAN